MKTIYLIDDSPGRHVELRPLLNSLNANPGAVPEYAATCPNDGSEANTVAKNSVDVNVVWTTVSQAAPHSIFLIDLKLAGVNETTSCNILTQFINNETEIWGNEARRLLNDAASNYQLLLSTYSTAVLACAVLKARGISFILVSTAAAADIFTPWCEAWDIPAAQSRAREQWKSWKDEIVKLHRHPDQITRNILDGYHNSIAMDESAWTHDWCQDHIQEGRKIWRCEGIDDSSNKALHCRSNNGWMPYSEPSRPIASGTLNCIFKELGFKFPVRINCDGFAFPFEPGIVFLLSLRELVVAMGSPSPKEISFGMNGELYYVSVGLDNASPLHSINRLLTKAWKLHQTFSEKEVNKQSIQESIPAGGFSEAIFHLCHSRLGGIRGDDDWVRLFRNGSEQWVMWPCFTDEGITFYWKA